MHIISSTPLPKISEEYSTNPGKCLAEHVGVKAPGTENTTIFLLEKCLLTSIFVTPPAPIYFNVAVGIVFPTSIVIKFTPIIIYVILLNI
jgi:hypothetical protein